jgi:hypothetical protein
MLNTYLIILSQSLQMASIKPKHVTMFFEIVYIIKLCQTRIIDRIELAQDRQVAGTCECGNEPSVSTKCGEFLD